MARSVCATQSYMQLLSSESTECTGCSSTGHAWPSTDARDTYKQDALMLGMRAQRGTRSSRPAQIKECLTHIKCQAQKLDGQCSSSRLDLQ